MRKLCTNFFVFQLNNNIATLNILWSLKEDNLLKTIFVETTTTGVYGTPDFNINEGFNILNKKPIPFHNLGGSWYHISKSSDCNYLWLANRLWGLTIIDFRTAITLGLNIIKGSPSCNIANALQLIPI